MVSDLNNQNLAPLANHALIGDRYEILSLIGNGSMGEVFKVFDRLSSSEYALKIWKTSSKQQGVEQELSEIALASEFQILRSLYHPAIAAVYSYGTDVTTQRNYLVSELINGSDLFVATEQAKSDFIEELFVQALRGLNYLHRHGIFHYDIKPQNLLVATSLEGFPVLKIIDFGLANYYSTRLQKNDEKKAVIGTPMTMPPEMFKGRPQGARSDLYSLACSFYRAWTRRYPHGLDDHGVYLRDIRSHVIKPSELAPQLPKVFDDILLKMLSDNPADRYPSAEEVLQDLNRRLRKLIPIETPETLFCYLPERGELVGRVAEWNRFLNLFDDRLSEKGNKKRLPFFVLSGETGIGKTRFLKSCRDEALHQKVKVVDYKDWQQQTDFEIKQPLLVLADNDDLSKIDWDYLVLRFQNLPFLLLLTSLELPQGIPSDAFLQLAPLTVGEIEEYLKKVAGLKKIPERIVSILQERTHGYPALLVEEVRQWLAHGFLRDTAGGWTEDLLDDLSRHWSSLPSKNLSSLSSTATKNELYQNSQLQQQAASEKALFLERKGGNRDEILRLRALGVDRDAYGALLELVRRYKEQARYPEALENITLFLTRFSPVGKPTALELTTDVIEAHLNRLELLILLGEFQSVTEEAERLMAILFTGPSYLKILELAGVAFLRRGDAVKAKSLFEKGLALAGRTGGDLVDKVIFYNRLAQVAFAEGDAARAEEMFHLTWDIWSRHLSLTDQLRSIRTDLDLIFVLQGDPLRALQIAQTVHQVAEKDPSSEAYLITLYKVGQAHVQASQWQEAENYLKKCLELSRHRGVITWLDAVYNELGNLHLKQGEASLAVPYYRQAMDLSWRTSRHLPFLQAAYNLANALYKAGDLSQALSYFEYVHQQFMHKKFEDVIPATTCLFITLMGLAVLYRETKQVRNSRPVLEEARRLIQQHDFLKNLRIYLDKEEQVSRY